jgi:TonB family protein
MLIQVVIVPHLIFAQITIEGNGKARYNSGYIELKLIPEKPDHIICFFFYNDMKYSSLEFKADVSVIKAKNFKSYIKENKLIGDGEYAIYYSTGGKRKVIIFKNNINTGYVKTFYQNGNAESEYIPRGNEIFESVTYNKEGLKQLSVTISKSEKNKKYTYFYEKGTPKYEVSYLNDTLDGYLRMYNPDSSIQRIELFKNNKSVRLECYSQETSKCPQLIDTLKLVAPNFPKFVSKEVISKDSFVFITFTTDKENCKDVEYHGPESLKKEILNWFNSIRWEREKLNGKECNSDVVIAYNLKELPDFKLYRNFKPDLFESNYFFTNSTTSLVSKVGEKMPEFPGGIDKMMKYLGSNIRYPAEATEFGIQGRVIVSFIICSDGSMCNYRIFKGVSEELDNEAIRVVSQMPRWIPGTQFGKPVPVLFTLPIVFCLKE